ncbi:hypothetical protein WA1_49325 [Scytonema hofmannii PCC 7110]|uniref:Uncharacterized protein n=1 Tax=Scytonema hofmannii PCC 7110 TaxID=128403 RepID=A0A139WR82_9CYAN|nr:hypothetical protein WA1_49325 [Scytonema hofmannii PCC 7110]
MTQTFPEPIATTREVNLPPNIIHAVIKTHAAGEANINKLATQYKISTQDAINIILNHGEINSDLKIFKRCLSS